ncbi:MAG: radical SAM protein [Phycisphaerae bacterium]|nr:radical SAM protein [Phycisphaerae bacterium]
MIDISVLYCGYESPSTPHRYGRAIGRDVPCHQRMEVATSAMDRRPIVVWNITRTCNLKCVHCYSDSEAKSYEGELSGQEVRRVLDDLAAFKVPAVLFSGGEPLIRPDLFELIEYARGKGLHVVLSTNGTLITPEIASRLVDLKLAYVGISLDSATPAVHDKFRGTPGAFERTMRGFRNCVEAGQKVGLRLTLSRPTFENLDGVFDFIEAEKINRACFYHLVPTGRGKGVLDLSRAESRQAMDTILRRTRDFHERGLGIEILTVDNHCDGPYMFLKMKAAGDQRAYDVRDMLVWNGGGLYSSGVGIGCIDFYGKVHPNQFWMHYSLGNVRDRPFSEIWQDTSDDLMAGLKDRLSRLKGRCGLCKYQSLCGGALRVRAQLMTGDPWAADPACYLTDEEIGLRPEQVAELKAKGEYHLADG